MRECLLYHMKLKHVWKRKNIDMFFALLWELKTASFNSKDGTLSPIICHIDRLCTPSILLEAKKTREIGDKGGKQSLDASVPAELGTQAQAHNIKGLI